MNGEISVRFAEISDAAALSEIYRPYVLKTAITFEYAPPSAEEFAARIEKTKQKYPYICAEINGKIVGYAYASSFVGRKAYEHSAETSIYVEMSHRKHGVGRRLYETLEKLLAEMNVYNVCACIGVPSGEADGHLDRNSEYFHAHLGYRYVGNFEKCGFKFGSWYDMIWMEKILNEHPDSPPEFVNVNDLSTESIEKCGIKIDCVTKHG
ncbi:MAG: GNAT family N-acetyltransferase [Oscillospiraceae bacterium]